MIIDTHTHLYVEQFDTDYKEVIQRSRKILPPGHRFLLYRTHVSLAKNIP